MTFNNSLGELPPGALIEATNVVIDRPGIIEPRRGLNDYGDSFPSEEDRAKQLLVYKGRILRHYFDNFDDVNYLQFDSDGAGNFETFDGTYNETETGLRIKGQEVNGNFYFTTDEGIKKLAVTSASNLSTSTVITDAGGANALDLKTTINYSQSGFLLPLSKVAYRVTWGTRDVNNNTIEGTPSERSIVTNFDTVNSAVVDLEFSVPEKVTTDYFYRIYRTAVSTTSAMLLNDLDPGDEMNLVFEAPVTSAQISAGMVQETDITPEDFRAGGLPLYTNPVTGEGIDQANDSPPLAKDITLFRGSTFYSNTKTKHRKYINLLTTDDFQTGSSKLVIANGVDFNVYTFVGTKEVTPITFDTQTNTTDGGYWLMNSANDERKYVFYFDKTGTTPAPTGNDTEGRLIIPIDISGVAGGTNVSPTVKTTIEASTAADDFAIVQTSGAILTFTNTNNGSCSNATVGLVSPGGTFAIGSITQGTGEDTSTNSVLISDLPTVGQKVDETARSLVRIINQNDNETVYARYLSGPEDVPGEILLESRTNEDVTFFLAVNDEDISGSFNPSLPVYEAITNISVDNPTEITSMGHGLTTGNEVVIFDSDSTSSVDGVFNVTVLDSDTFTVPVEVTVVGTSGFWFLASQASDNEVAPNRIYFSKYQQPEAVPLVNFIDVGPKDKEIKRIIALRDSLFILKEDGVYRLSGNSPQDFSVALFDGNCHITAPDSASTLNNQIFLLAHDGVANITDTGTSNMSRDIENLIYDATTSAHIYYKTASFGIGYEIDHAYLLWLTTDTSDTVATQCYRYNIYTSSWTKLDLTSTCAAVGGDEKIYVGVGDRNVIQQERKNRDRRDYADREISLSIGSNSIEDNQVVLSSVEEVEIGDVLSQTQYLTIFEFNLLLNQLDLDQLINDPTYFDDLEAVPGDSLRQKVNDLANKLDTEPGLDGDYASSITGTNTFVATQSDFNIIVNKLNLDDGAFFTTYDISEDTKPFEMVITDIEIDTNTAILQNSLPYVQGDVTLVKGISTSVVWAPQAFGDPSILKQVKEGSILFERNVFTNGTLSYSSDLSEVFEPIDFVLPGAGIWGYFNWSEQTWSGEGTGIPLRTLVPMQKQRCRYLNVKFEHVNAFEKFSILGISLSPRPLSERAWR